MRRPINSTLCLLASTGLLASIASAQADPWRGTLLTAGSSKVPPGFTSLQRNDQAAAELQGVSDAIITGLPLSADLTVDALLTRIEPYAPGAQIVYVDDAGEHAMAAPPVAIFHGQLAGHEGSNIFLSISPWWIYGYANVGDHQYIISTGPAIDPHPPVVYDPQDISADDLAIVIPPCLTDTTGFLQTAARHGGGTNDRSGPCRVAKIAYESDYELTQVFGGDPVKSTAYIATVGAAMNDIYTRDVQTHINICYSRVWTTSADPWTAADTGSQLDEFRAYWASKMFQVSRNLAEFLSARGLGGGVAWLSVLCNSQWGYAVDGNLAGSFPYPLQDNRGVNWDPYVIAHEMGHNFGTVHTHEYDPPIDTCGLGQCAGYLNNGTIMSYCHGCIGGVQNIKLKFGDRVSDRILQYLQDEAPCELADLPHFTKQPSDTTVAKGGTAKFQPGVTGPGVLRFQWIHDGVDIPGATVQQLTITGVGADDIGQYVLRVSNDCNTILSNPATLLVQCPADFDGSLFVDAEDFNAFVGAFTQGLPSADFDKSGFVDTEDYDAFVLAFESGC